MNMPCNMCVFTTELVISDILSIVFWNGNWVTPSGAQ